jgi:hypothetical protein
MTIKSVFTTLLIAGGLYFINGCCSKNSVQPDFPVYSYATTIVNPPSHFQVNYIVSSPGDRTANITFDTNSVWAVAKLGDKRVLYSINNGIDNLTISISDTIAFEGGKQYLFTANNFSSISISNFLVNFNKQADDYSSFPKKF